MVQEKCYFLEHVKIIKDDTKRIVVCLYPFGRLLNRLLLNNGFTPLYPIQFITDDSKIQTYFNEIALKDNILPMSSEHDANYNTTLSVCFLQKDLHQPIPELSKSSSNVREFFEAFANWIQNNSAMINQYLHQVRLGGDEPVTLWECIYAISSCFTENIFGDPLYQKINCPTPLDFSYILDSAFNIHD